MIERFQFATTRDRDAYVDEIEAKALGARQEYERQNMSPDIRPEHYEMCLTQRIVAKHGDLECDAPPETHVDRDDLAKPAEATRIRVEIAEDGRETKTPIVNDPRDAAVGAEAGVEAGGK